MSPAVGAGVTQANVKTDQKAALALARLHAAGLVLALWNPSEPVRQLRALVARRAKMVRLATQAKNQLHAILYRLRKPAPAGRLFDPDRQAWWLALPVSGFELTQVECDWDTLQFAERQDERLNTALNTQAATETRVPLAVQLPGFGLIVAMTVLPAVGTIHHFERAKHLVGYAGLGARVHDTGELHRPGFKGVERRAGLERRAGWGEAQRPALPNKDASARARSPAVRQGLTGLRSFGGRMGGLVWSNRRQRCDCQDKAIGWDWRSRRSRQTCHENSATTAERGVRWNKRLIEKISG
jgi:hypothetical protein